MADDGLYWHTLDFRTLVFVDKSGRIHGGVDAEYRTYRATVNAKYIGSYITEEKAQRAVEKAVREPVTQFIQKRSSDEV